MPSKGCYSAPSWAASTSDSSIDPFSLEVLKDGVISNKIDLPLHNTRSYYTLGRQEGTVDIFLAHASISRTHAMLQYRNDGALLLFDNNSAHGTSINKKVIEKGIHHRLYVGDMIKFGASTRLYIVNGPENQTLSAINTSATGTSSTISTSAALEQASDDMDTGISLGHEESNEEKESYKKGREELELPDYLQGEKGLRSTLFETSLNKTDVHKKDMALYEKIKAKESKIQNLQKENQRIHAKENTQDEGLTSGQQSTLQRNDAHIEKLQKEIETMTSTLQQKSAERMGQTAEADVVLRGQTVMLESFYEDDAIRDLTEDSGKKKKRRFGRAPSAPPATTTSTDTTIQQLSAISSVNSNDGVIDLKVLKSMPPLEIDYNPPVTSHFDLSMDMNRLLALQDDVEYKIADYNKVIQSKGSYLGLENNMSGGGLRSGDGDYNDEINKLLGQDIVKIAKEENARLMDEYREISQKVLITKRHMDRRDDAGQEKGAKCSDPSDAINDYGNDNTTSVFDGSFIRPSLPMPQTSDQGAISIPGIGTSQEAMAPPSKKGKRKVSGQGMSSLSAVLNSQALQNNANVDNEENTAAAEKDVVDMAEWSIPHGQSGDGATSLNKKYNY